jgi:hypothetical protein
MGSKPFDLIEAISDLLRRIDEGRKTVSETQHVSDNFRKAFANREEVDRLIRELQRKIVPPDGPGLSEVNAELDRLMSKRGTLLDESEDLWRQFGKTIEFIGPFKKDVLLLLDRLPLKTEWDVYRQALGNLNVGERDSWTNRPKSAPLVTLEMRLREMLKLATGVQGGKVRQFDPFPTPDGAIWKDVSITFVSDHRVRIAVRSVTQTRSYAEMGFEDRRGGGGKPDSAWECLKLLAKSAGRIERPADFRRQGWPKVEKQVQAIRARLKELFGIRDEPLPFLNRRVYEAQFTIKVGNSIEH